MIFMRDVVFDWLRGRFGSMVGDMGVDSFGGRDICIAGKRGICIISMWHDGVIVGYGGEKVCFCSPLFFDDLERLVRLKVG